MTYLEMQIRESDAIKNIPLTNPYDEVINLILNTKGLILMSGVGKAGEIASLLVSKFNSISIRSLFLDGLSFKHGNAGIVTEDSVLILFSNSSMTEEIINIVNISNIITDNKIKKILITGNLKGELNSMTDLVLYTGSNKEMLDDQKVIEGLIPTISTTLMNHIGNMLTIKLVEKTKIKIDKYKYNHHSGYISSIIKETENLSKTYNLY